MATLQELENEYVELSKKVNGLKGKTKATKESMKANTEDRKRTSEEIQALEQLIPNLTDAMNIANVPTIVEFYKKNLDEQSARLEELKKHYEELENAIPAKTQEEIELEQAENRMDEILVEFAADPRINQYLEEEVMLRARKTIEGYGKEVKRIEEENDSFAKAMVEDKELSEKVKAFVDATKTFNDCEEYPSSKAEEEKRSNADKARIVASTELSKYAGKLGIHLKGKADFNAILSYAEADSKGTFELPSLQDAIKEEKEKREKFIEKAYKKVALITNAKLVVSGEKTAEEDLEKEIASKEDEKQKVELTITDIATKMSDIKDNLNKREALETRIAELEDKGNNDKPSAEVEEAKKALEKAQRDLAIARSNDKQPITKDDITGKYGEEGTSKFEELFAADLVVRKAIIAREATNESIDPKANENLENAINEYRKAMEYFVSKGYDGKELHNAILLELNNKIKNKETIDEAYNTDIIPHRIKKLSENLDNKFKVGDEEFETSDVMNSIDESLNTINTEVEEILSSSETQEYKLNGSNLNTVLAQYDNNVGTLFEGIKSILDLKSIDEIYSKLKGAIAQKVGFFKKIFGKFKQIISGEPKQKLFNASEPKEKSEEVKNAEKAVEDAKKAYEEAKQKDEKDKEFDVPLTEELSEEEKQELASKKAELDKLPETADLNAQLTSLTTQLDSAQSTIDSLKASIAQLQIRQNELETKRSRKSTIEYSTDINHGQGQKLVDEAIKKFDDEAR